MRRPDLRSVAAMLIVVMLTGACGSSDGVVGGLDGLGEPTTAPAPDPTPMPDPTTAPDPTPIPDPTAVPDPTATPQPTALPDPTATAEPPESATVADEDLWRLDWQLVNATYLPNTGPSNDPFFHIHTSNEADGFYLSFEMFTIWGAAWTGQTGTFEISCLDVAGDTGICVHLDPDGPGPAGDIAADFGATGEMTIHQLDASGYLIDVHSLTFTDGTTFAPFEMSG